MRDLKSSYSYDIFNLMHSKYKKTNYKNSNYKKSNNEEICKELDISDFLRIFRNGDPYYLKSIHENICKFAESNGYLKCLKDAYENGNNNDELKFIMKIYVNLHH